MKRVITILGLLAMSAGCAAEELLSPVNAAPKDDFFATIPKLEATVTGRGGAAATVDVRGTLAALEILKRGGNAVDAAVAAASVVGVTDPFSCGIGGGGFMVIYLADQKRVVTIDHRETAPAALDSKLLYENGAPIAFDELVTSGLSVGVPGTVRGWDEALRRYGTLGFDEVLERAIWVAEEGFDVDQTFFDQTGRNVDRFQAFTSTQKIYLTADGKAFPVGTIFKNPDLGKTYRLIAAGGGKAFYEGEIAAAIVKTAKEPPVVAGSMRKVRPGVLDLADLANYEARVRPAVESTYRGYTLYGMGLPSSGGLTVALALNILEGYDLTTPTEILHRYISASRLAFADRGAFLGDPGFVDVPVKGLLSKDYAAERRALIDLQKAPTTAASPGNPFAYQNDPSTIDQGSGTPFSADSNDAADAFDKETTHISVSDANGNIVAYTCTIESEGGNGMVVPGYGFLLNNELTDFNMPTDPNAPHPNIAEPGKRPRSSISPTLVFKDGKPKLSLGSPGGSTIITTVLQMLVAYADLDMPIDKALGAPRVSQRNTPDGVSTAEAAFMSTPEAAGLMALGHVFTDKGTLAGQIGAATAISFNPDGTVTAAAEPTRRGGGSAMVEQAP
jgi:gamma-glutamyltranspeptidase/glutathione hydrolase